MRSSIILAALASLVAAIPQGTPTTLLPPSEASGCAATFDNGASFEIGIINGTSALAKRQENAGLLTLTLNNGLLMSNDGKIGYISGADQVQFDNPVQAGALITGGWRACPNGTLALASALFYECLTSVNGREVFNLYDTPIGGQCDPAFIMIIPTGPPSTTTTAAITTGVLTTSTSMMTIQPVSIMSDGQPIVGTASTTITSVTTRGAPSGTISMLPPFNATSSLRPFSAGVSLHPVSSTGGMAILISFASLIGLSALVL